jgi:23S rRNA pseudouridine1911/1915/1917 synthase
MTPSIDVLFEDNHCLAVAKPAPLLTQAPPDVPSLEARVREYLRERYRKAGRVYLGVPHRLDRPVSGVVLFARTTKAARRLAEQFQQRTVTKVYWAAVDGDVEPCAGTWEDWVRKVPDEPRAEKADPGGPAAQRAVLSYRRLGRCRCGCVLEVRPLTGRMHQIRLQAALHGFPVRGDELYGSRLPFGPAAVLPRDRIIALHARALTFLHPIRYESITVEAPLGEAWHALEVGPGADGWQATGHANSAKGEPC